MRKRDLIMCKIDLLIYLEREIQKEREPGREKEKKTERDRERKIEKGP
jgi:hypothetical protein